MKTTFAKQFKAAVGGIAFGAVLFAGFSGSVLAERVIKVATEPTFPPFEFVDTKQDLLTGFEVELVQEIGKEIGAKMDYKVLGFDAIIPALMAGTVDMGAAGFSITDERKKRVLFSDPFYQSGLSVLVKNDNAAKFTTMESLAGHTIGVQIGTTSHTAAKKIQGATVKTFNTAGDAILELANGGCEAVINDRPVTAYILTQQPKFAAMLTHQPQSYSADDFAFTFRKDSKELRNEVNAALAKLKADGRYAAIYKKWFGND